jgi:hypothetical protein
VYRDLKELSKTICTRRSVSTSLSEIPQRSDEIPLGLDHFHNR